MAELEIIAQEGADNTRGIDAADVVVAIPTYNDRDTAAASVDACLAARNGRLSSARVVLVNADGSSKDGTAAFVRERVAGQAPLIQVRYPVYPVHRFEAPLAGVPGRGEALEAIFTVARQLGAKACVVLDADVRSTEPEWIDRLTGPILDDAVDVVVPHYQRHKFDGLINTGIVYPLTRSLYGKQVRQPAGADLAFSARAMEVFSAPERPEKARPAAAEPWSIVTAICSGLRVAQTYVGSRVMETKEVAPDLSSTLRHVLGTLFEQIEGTVSYWQRVRASESVPWFGPPAEVVDEPAPVNLKRMIDTFRLGLTGLHEIWSSVLPPGTLFEIRRIGRLPDESFRFSDHTWARTVYDFALGYHSRVIGRDHLLAAMTPLYLAWAASFIGELQAATQSEADARGERLAAQFEAEKRYLVSRWRWPDKFNP